MFQNAFQISQLPCIFGARLLHSALSVLAVNDRLGVLPHYRSLLRQFGATRSIGTVLAEAEYRTGSSTMPRRRITLTKKARIVLVQLLRLFERLLACVVASRWAFTQRELLTFNAVLYHKVVRQSRVNHIGRGEAEDQDAD